MQRSPQRPQLFGVGGPLQYLEDPSSAKAPGCPWSHCSTRLIQDMACKAQPRMEWGQPHQSEMKANNEKPPASLNISNSMYS